MITNTIAKAVANNAKTVATESQHRFLGFGNMSKYLFAQSLQSGQAPFHITTSTEQRTYEALQALKEGFPQAKLSADISSFGNMRTPSGQHDRDICFIAVKPQIFKKLPTENFPKPFLDTSALMVHMMAGIPTQVVQEKLERSEDVIRIMPNLNAENGSGVIAIYGHQNNRADDRVVDLMNTFANSSTLIEVENEEAFHGLTLAIGSLPAFIWEFTKRAEYWVGCFFGTEDVAQQRIKVITHGLLNDIISERFHESKLKPIHKSSIAKTISEIGPLPKELVHLKNQLSDEITSFINGIQKAILQENSASELISEEDLNAALFGTLLGSIRTYAKKDLSLTELQSLVRSAKGTTDAGLKVLEARGGSTTPITEETAYQTAVATLLRSRSID